MNKSTSWIKIFAAQVFVFGSIAALFPIKSVAATVNLTCQTDTETPKVVASFAKEETVKDVLVLSFLPKYFSPQNAIESCQKTANKLQVLYNTDDANYLTTDKVNNKSVVCVVERRGMSCVQEQAQILFTFESTENPTQVFYEMLGDDFKQVQPLDIRTVSRIYSDIKPRRFLWWKF